MNFQKPTHSLTPQDRLFITGVLVLILGISTVLFFINQTLPAGGGEFLTQWVGARAITFENIDPYSAYVPEQVQKLLQDKKAESGNDPYILDTPLHLLILYVPFSLLSNPLTAQAIFTLFLQWALLLLAWLSLRLTEWQAPRWFIALFFIFTISNFYTYQAIIEASPVLLLVLFYATALLALRNEQDELAGALIAASFYFWEVGLPFIALLAWFTYQQKRVRFFAGFGMITLLVLILAWFIYPNWLIPWLRAAWNNLQFNYGFTIITAFETLSPAYGQYIAYAIILTLVIALGYEWNTLTSHDTRRFYWVACLSIAAAPFLGFRTELENLSTLTLPLALIFAVAYDRWYTIGSYLTTLLLFITLLFPWAITLFLKTTKPEFAQNLLFLFLPAFTLVGLYWIRWWAIRPPRIWADSLTR